MPTILYNFYFCNISSANYCIKLLFLFPIRCQLFYINYYFCNISSANYCIKLLFLLPIRCQLFYIIIIAPFWKSGGYTGFALSFRHSVILSFTFQMKIFVTLFSGTVRSRRLKFGTHVWTVGRCIVYTGIRLLLLICLFIFSLFFLSNFQTLNFFVTLFSGTVRPRRLKLGTHGQWAVYRNQAATAYSFLYFLIFSLSNFQILKFFVTLFSGTVMLRRLKLGTHMDSGQMYRVYRNQVAAAYLSLYFFIFLSLQFSNIKIFRHTFLRKCEA